MASSPVAPLTQLNFGPLPAVRENSKLSNLPPIKKISKKKKKKTKSDAMMQLLRQELETVKLTRGKKRIRKGSLASHIPFDNDGIRSDEMSSLSTSRLPKLHTSLSFSQRSPSSINSHSACDMYQMSDYERKRFELLQTLDKMGVRFPKRERQMSGTELNMYENLMCKRRNSLNSRMIDAATRRGCNQSPSVDSERNATLTPVERGSPEMTNEQREKLKYITDIMSKTENKSLKSENPVLQPLTRSKNSSQPGQGSDHRGDALVTIQRRFRRKNMSSGQKFRKLAKFLVLLLRAWRIHSQNVSEVLRNFYTLDAMTKTEGSQDLLFDVTEYKAAKEAKISAETKRILLKKPGTRTEKELRYVNIALRNYKSIAEYPIRIQRMLAERGCIETYNAKRVIIREGHIPSCFYFLLTGSAVVSVLDSKTQQAKMVLFLNRGDSFGEQAIMTRSLRQTTVITRETVELLVISDTDFVDIFMSGGLRDPNDPFIRSIDFLNDWPREKLADNPKKAMFCVFKRGTILAADSCNNDWLFVVKSGSCSVFKKLDHVNPKRYVHKAREKLWRDKVEETLKRDEIISHREQITLLNYDEVKKFEQKNLHLRGNALPEINIDTNNEYSELRDLYQDPTYKNDITKPSGVLPPVTRPGTVITEAESKYRRHYPNLRQKSRASLNTLIAKGPFLTKNKPQNAASIAEHQRSLSETTEYDHEGITRSTVTTPEKDPDPQEEKPPIFIQVRILTKGMAFGLTDLLFDGQASLSLVSNGVEVIMINKKFFMENMTNDKIVRLKEKTYPYPSEEDLKKNLEFQLGWDHYKKISVSNALRAVKIQKSDVNDSRAFLNVPPKQK